MAGLTGQLPSDLHSMAIVLDGDFHLMCAALDLLPPTASGPLGLETSGAGGAVAPPPPAPTAMAHGQIAATLLHELEAALSIATTKGEPGVLLPHAYPVKDMSAADCAALVSAAGTKCKVEGKYARFTEQKLYSERYAESYTANHGAPPPSKVAHLFTCARSPKHAGRRPVQKAVWLVNSGTDGAPHWVWVFEACATCQSCRRAALAAVKLEVKVEEQAPGAGTGGAGPQDAGGAPPAKRHKPAASNGASPAEATAVPAVPAAAPQAAMHAVPQAAVHICNAMDGLLDADRTRCADLLRRIAARLRPVPRDCESFQVLVRQRSKLLAKLKKGAGTISGDRYELWCIVNNDCTAIFGSAQDANDGRGAEAAEEVFKELLTADDRALLCMVVRAARDSHLKKLRPASNGGQHTWGVMALIITAGDVNKPVDGMSRRQPWHVDVVDGHAISLVSLLPGHKATQFVVPKVRATLRETLLQLGIPEVNLPEAFAWLNLSTYAHLVSMLPGALPVLQRRETLIVSDEGFIADFGHQTVMENLVVHRGLDSPAEEPRIILFLTSTDVGGASRSGYDKALQYTRYQFPLALWRLEDSLYWLYKDRVDVPEPGKTYGWGDLSNWLTDFVKEATAADDEARRTVAQRRAHEPDATWIADKAKALAPVYLTFLEGVPGKGGVPVGGELSHEDVNTLKRKEHFPPSWAKHYFE